MARLTPLEAAQQRALRGAIEAAAAEFSALEAEGNMGAAVALAEIAAYQGRWEEVLRHVATVLGNPSGLRSLNVYTDMIGLAARAGKERGNWAEIEKLAAHAQAHLGKKGRDSAHAAAARRLGEYAARGREGTVTSVATPEEGGQARFEAALEGLQKKPKRFRSAEARSDHLFGLARVFGYSEGAVLLYDQKEALPGIFDNVVFAASALAKVSRGEEAWQAIRQRLDRWWPVEDSQIAPVVLLTDEALAPLMTTERRMEVLRTPRGPEAQAD